MEEDNSYKLYVVSELNYINENKNILKEKLFPENWYSINDYNLKIRIILEAIENNILVKETKLYQNIIEGNK